MSKAEEKAIEITYWQASGMSWLELARKWFNNENVRVFCCDNARESFDRMDKAKEVMQ